MTQSFISWVPYLVFFGGLLSFSQSVTWAAGRITADQPIMTRRLKIVTKITQLAPSCALLLVGIVLGVVGDSIYRDLESYRNTFTLTGLTVIKKYNDSEYMMAFSNSHQPFKTRFCDDYKPSFVEGTNLSQLTYENKGQCWSISSPKTGYLISRRFE